jgi:hypothetical protein
VAEATRHQRSVEEAEVSGRVSDRSLTSIILSTQSAAQRPSTKTISRKHKGSQRTLEDLNKEYSHQRNHSPQQHAWWLHVPGQCARHALYVRRVCPWVKACAIEPARPSQAWSLAAPEMSKSPCSQASAGGVRARLGQARGRPCLPPQRRGQVNSQARSGVRLRPGMNNP